MLLVEGAILDNLGFKLSLFQKSYFNYDSILFFLIFGFFFFTSLNFCNLSCLNSVNAQPMIFGFYYISFYLVLFILNFTLFSDSLFFLFFKLSYFSYIENVLQLFSVLATVVYNPFDAYYYFNYLSNVPLNVTTLFAAKFLLSIAFLIFIRGGTPRYRYDYLTRIGWLKFLGFTVILLVFILVLFVCF